MNTQEQAYINGFVKRAAEYNIPNQEALKLAAELVVGRNPGAENKNLYTRDVRFGGLDADKIKYLIAVGKKMTDQRVQMYKDTIAAHSRKGRNYGLNTSPNFVDDILYSYLKKYPKDKDKFTSDIAVNYVPRKDNINAQIASLTDDSKLRDYTKKEIERYDKETGFLKKLFTRRPTEDSIVDKLSNKEITNMLKTYNFGVLHHKANAGEVRKFLENSDPGVTGEMYFKKVVPK